MTPGEGRSAPPLETATPRQIVAELDRHVVGQAAAKRALAIALRNRWRRQQLPAEVADEIVPKNILMIGPTGVGKTELARRLAKLARAPFLKVEASKFTEVGYVGRDCESMIRDLAEIAAAMVRAEMREQVAPVAARHAEERLVALLVPQAPGYGPASTQGAEDLTATREKMRDKLRSGALDAREVEVDVEENVAPSLEMSGPQGIEEVGINLREMMPGLFSRRQRRKMPIAEARAVLEAEEIDKLIDRQQVSREARHRVEQTGIVFLDELDKVAGRERGGGGPDVSREGVQRDLLPIVEGTTVTTRQGPVRTDHILFVAAGAFHVARPSDLIPELQGRFPIRVELEALREEDLARILTEPENALTRQYTSLLGAEGVRLVFAPDSITEIARLAAEVNRGTENIGARRLATLLERLLEEVSFNAPEMQGVELVVDAAFVRRALADLVASQDLSRYVL
ncbi:MAG: ATP-dependent protease ATPase subunit HslU [Thermoanaerobaculia bacterium]|nr:MAG: ATP-dependent protease ATPase subunit HslU [Thermoanaerobaculia bacterium]MBZ0101928.1 ATP-dependent protease ATPase subunit HslU [Thermoanaerobaculia bacterium]